MGDSVCTNNKETGKLYTLRKRDIGSLQCLNEVSVFLVLHNNLITTLSQHNHNNITAKLQHFVQQVVSDVVEPSQ